MPDWVAWLSFIIAVVSLCWSAFAWLRPRNTTLYQDIRVTPIGLPDNQEVKVTHFGAALSYPTIATVRLGHLRGPELEKENFPKDAIRYEVKAASGQVGLLSGGQGLVDFDVNLIAVTVLPQQLMKKQVCEFTLIGSDIQEVTRVGRIANVAILDTTPDYWLDRRDWVLRIGMTWVIATNFVVALGFVANNQGYISSKELVDWAFLVLPLSALFLYLGWRLSVFFMPMLTSGRYNG